MLASKAAEAFGVAIPKCSGIPCPNQNMAEIEIHGYAEGRDDLWLCRECALQLSRKLLEDLCEVVAGDRHG